MSNGVPIFLRRQLGIGDRLEFSVYDAPDLTPQRARGRRMAISACRLSGSTFKPLGSLPDELEKAIAAALVEEHVMVSPIVSVTVVESHSRPITVMGAVKNPIHVSGCRQHDAP